MGPGLTPLVFGGHLAAMGSRWKEGERRRGIPEPPPPLFLHFLKFSLCMQENDQSLQSTSKKEEGGGRRERLFCSSVLDEPPVRQEPYGAPNSNNNAIMSGAWAALKGGFGDKWCLHPTYSHCHVSHVRLHWYAAVSVIIIFEGLLTC